MDSVVSFLGDNKWQFVFGDGLASERLGNWENELDPFDLKIAVYRGVAGAMLANLVLLKITRGLDQGTERLVLCPGGCTIRDLIGQCVGAESDVTKWQMVAVTGESSGAIVPLLTTIGDETVPGSLRLEETAADIQ
jgi:hypothetical protein